MFSKRCIWLPYSSSSTLTPPKSHMTSQTVLEYSYCTWTNIKHPRLSENETYFILSFANTLICQRQDDMHCSRVCWKVAHGIRIHGARLVTIIVNHPCDGTPKPVSFQRLDFVQTTGISSDVCPYQEFGSFVILRRLSRHAMQSFFHIIQRWSRGVVTWCRGMIFVTFDLYW